MKIFNMSVSANDWAHFWLPFIGLVMLSIICVMVPISDRQMHIVFLLLSLAALSFQALNEAYQYYTAKDKTAFKENSKKDWFLFFLGWMAGAVIYAIVIGIFL